MKKTLYLCIILAVIIATVYLFRSKPTPAPATSQTTSTASSTIQYTNTQYCFIFTLPIDWQGYTVLSQAWTGNIIHINTSTPQTEHGPEILIRNPHWTAASTWQDIPILVFTTAQWAEVSQENLAIGAAPIPPSKLGDNSTYVFALPARYNYAYPQGWQEVQTIMQGNPLHGF
jgi:hypothetical protein